MVRDAVSSDEALLERVVAEDDHDAFAALMRRHEDRIFALAMRMTGDRSDALDATQDAFITTYRQRASFRGDSSFGTWLYRIAINACNDLLRKRARTPVPTEDDADSRGHERATAGVLGRPGNLEEAVTARVDIARALARLPAEYREAVVMYDLGGIPYEEIAALTGAALGTTKSRISRGRRKLAELLEHQAHAEASKD